MKQKSHKDMFVIGFALFSMFFGAGNVIFPPYLGMSAGPLWFAGFLCYYLADIGLALLSMFAIFHRGGAEHLMEPVGKVASTILMCAIVLCIGPMLAIPRTAAMTFEMSVQPFTSGRGSILFSILFFGIVFLCTVRESSVIDIIGKVLTPLLLGGLLILIIIGVISPMGEISEVPLVPSAATDGIEAGYQTMDVLATMLFGAIILKSAESKGYTEHDAKKLIACRSSIVAGVILFVIYGGLTYLGATASGSYDLSTGRSELLLAIVTALLGSKGTILFSIVVALACMTTAVGLVSSCSDYFSELSGRKISYRAMVTVICVFSAVVSNAGLEQLVSIASPVLSVVYPPALVLIILSFIPDIPALSYRLAMLGALIVSFLSTISESGFMTIPMLSYLPLNGLGFGWLLPSAVLAMVGWLVVSGHKKSR